MGMQSTKVVIGDPMGGTFPIEIVTPTIDVISLEFSTANLASNYYLTYQTPPVLGQKYSVVVTASDLNLNGNELNIFGYNVSIDQANQLLLRINFMVINISGIYPVLNVWINNDVSNTTTIVGTQIYDNSLPLSKLTGMTSGQMIVADGSNVAQAVTMSGDATIDASGALAIGAGKVTNTMLAGSIARTKLASGTADRVLTNNGAGTYAEVAQLTPKLGGTGIDNSGATGFLTYNSGTASVGVITDSKVVPISLETGFLGDYKVLFPFACTITGVYGSVSKAVAATDDATITIKNNSGTTMTGGVLTFPASSAKGTAVTGAISANNVISAGQVVTITGAKTTAGGEVLTVLTYTRTA